MMMPHMPTLVFISTFSWESIFLNALYHKVYQQIELAFSCARHIQSLMETNEKLRAGKKRKFEDHLCFNLALAEYRTAQVGQSGDLGGFPLSPPLQPQLMMLMAWQVSLLDEWVHETLSEQSAKVKSISEWQGCRKETGMVWLAGSWP